MAEGSGGSGADAPSKSSVSSNIKLSLPEFDGDNWDEFKLAFTSAIVGFLYPTYWAKDTKAARPCMRSTDMMEPDVYCN